MSRYIKMDIFKVSDGWHKDKIMGMESIRHSISYYISRVQRDRQTDRQTETGREREREHSEGSLRKHKTLVLVSK